jgi:hypothetical protein
MVICKNFISTLAIGFLAVLLVILPLFLDSADTAARAQQNQDTQAQITDIIGATVDTQTREVILVGTQFDTLPPVDLDNLTVALRTRYDVTAEPEELWPGVTIEFSQTNERTLDVTYFGKVRDTYFGYVLFAADRLLKSYGMGHDNVTGEPVPIDSAVPDYQSELACLEEQNFALLAGQQIVWRKWFSPTLEILTTEENDAIVFDTAQITLNWAYVSAATHPAVDVCAQAFVDHFNAHYQDFANEQLQRGNPVLHELVQLGKLTAIAEWLYSREPDTSIPGLNLPWLNTLSVPPHETPGTTPNIIVTEGALIQSGGVDLIVTAANFRADTTWIC